MEGRKAGLGDELVRKASGGGRRGTYLIRKDRAAGCDDLKGMENSDSNLCQRETLWRLRVNDLMRLKNQSRASGVDDLASAPSMAHWLRRLVGFRSQYTDHK